MDEQRETPTKEQVVVPPELAERMGEATRAIEADRTDPQAEITNAAGQMSMFAELGSLAKDTTKRRLGVMFKDAKAALGILPFINKISEVKFGTGAGTTVHAVESAAKTEVSLRKSQSALQGAEDSLTKAATKYEKAMDKGKGIDKATGRYRQAEQSFFEAERKQTAAQEAYSASQKHALDKLQGTTVPETPEKWSSKTARKLAHIKTDPEMRQQYDALKAEFEQYNVAYTEADLLRMTANGEVPAFTKGEKIGRGAKKLGLHMLLENLGPIINPVPDVPGPVTLVSYGVEAFGGQWWAGLVPPVWQYLHNRYEDFKIGMESSKKSAEIITRHWNRRVDRILDKKLERSAGVFLKPNEMRAAV